MHIIHYGNMSESKKYQFSKAHRGSKLTISDLGIKDLTSENLTNRLAETLIKRGFGFMIEEIPQPVKETPVKPVKKAKK
jgi:hypothetical protein